MMKKEIKLDPLIPVGRIKEKILRQELHLSEKYSEDEVSQILSILPVRVESTLHNYRVGMLGTSAKDRDSYDPSQVLSIIRGGENVLVLDSRDLPQDWKNISLREMFSGGNVNNEGCSTDDEVASSGDENPLDDLLEALNESSFNISDSPDPKRVLVFTSVRLLGVLSVSKKGSVDGTFKSSARDWYQLFILCVEYRGKFIPVAFGWLPDKKPISYFTFIVLVLLAFKEKENEILEMYGKSELKLRKIKCDYEVAIHKGLDMFTLSGCYFHFSQAIWRKVMMSGLYVAYMQDKQFNRFVRMVMALAFLPINTDSGSGQVERIQLLVDIAAL